MSHETSPDISRATRDILRAHFGVDALDADWSKKLKRELSHPQARACAVAFQNDLARAILKRTISPALYQELTGEDFGTHEALEDWLREIWQNLYGDAPVEEA